MPQSKVLRITTVALVLCGSITAVSAGGKLTPGAGDKQVRIVSCKKACMFGFEKCRKKVIGNDKESD